MSNATQSTYQLEISALDRFTAPFKKIAAAMRGATGDAKKLDKAIDNVNGNKINIGASFGRLKEVGAQYAAFGQTVTAALGLATGGLGALVGVTSSVVSETKKLSMMAGTSTQTWQQYAHAAQMAGVEQEELASTMKDLASFANLAALGEKTELEKFGFLGIDFKNAQGEIRTTDAMMLDLADKMKALIDSGQGQVASGLLDEVFGDSGTYLLPLLEKGSTGILEMRKQAEDLGLVFSDAQNKQAKEFSASFKGLMATFKSIAYAIGFELMPPFKEFMGTVKEWLSVNKQVFTDQFAAWVKSIKISDLVEGTKEFLSAVGKIPEVFSAVGKAFSAFSDFMGGTKNALIALGLVITGPLISAILGIGKALLLTPVGWFIGAMAAVGATAYAIYENWDGFKQYFVDIWDGIKAAFDMGFSNGIVAVLKALDPVPYVMDGMNALFKFFFDFDLKEAGIKLVMSFYEGLVAKWNEVVNWFKAQIADFTGMFSGISDALNFFGDDEDDAPKASPKNTVLNTPVQLGAPINMQKDGMPLATSRTETIEKQEVAIRVSAAPGAQVDMQGAPPKNVSLQTGVQNRIGP